MYMIGSSSLSTVKPEIFTCPLISRIWQPQQVHKNNEMGLEYLNCNLVYSISTSSASKNAQIS